MSGLLQIEGARAGNDEPLVVPPGLERVGDAIRRAQESLWKSQHEDGHWVFPLQADASITAEYLIYRRLMRLGVDERDRQAAVFLLATQQADGGWARYEGAESHLSLAIEAYFALKQLGHGADEPAMARARTFILSRGGLARAGVFTRIWLSYFGEFPSRGVPVMPVEIMLLPDRFPLSVYEMSSWARGTVVPLTILQALDFRVPLARPEMSVAELWCQDPARTKLFFDAGAGIFTLRRFFALLDRALHRMGALTQRRPLRARALHEAERWIRERQDRNGGWGGIVPAMLNSTLALAALCGPEDDAVRRGMQAIEDFTVLLPQGLMFQPCVSPVWDTVLVIKSLLDSGAAPDEPRLVRGAEWLLDRQIVGVRGDWAKKRPDAKPGGWAFEYENVHYPDLDDTVAVVTTLDRLALSDETRKTKAVQRGLRFALNMQSANGGWGAFDVDNVRSLWNEIPFADMKAMLDAPTADLTGRGLELLGHFGYSLSSRQAERALAFVTACQEGDGSFWGRWGVNYLYGTWSVLTGLARLGFGPDDPRVRRAADWLESCQNRDGGFGESPASYDHPAARGRGTSTPSQTAWAVMGLLAAGRGGSERVRRAIEYLLARQAEDGGWTEAEATGTGFPGHFYLRYHGYPRYFTLSALGLYLRDRARDPSPSLEGDHGSAREMR
ncbi:MAG TPA: squalene--hopene cyclase [Myxococcota bacterium]|nr:squalene--hopene cyclase [Myxococcota bacterium]